MYISVGTGYLTACFALMVGPQGRAVGVEHIPELVASSIQNIEKSAAAPLLKEGSLSVHVGGMSLAILNLPCLVRNLLFKLKKKRIMKWNITNRPIEYSSREPKTVPNHYEYFCGLCTKNIYDPWFCSQLNDIIFCEAYQRDKYTNPVKAHQGIVLQLNEKIHSRKLCAFVLFVNSIYYFFSTHSGAVDLIFCFQFTGKMEIIGFGLLLINLFSCWT